MDLNESQVAELVTRVVERLKEKGVDCSNDFSRSPAAEEATKVATTMCWTPKRRSNSDEPIKKKWRSPAAETPAANPKSEIRNPKLTDGLFEDIDSATKAAQRAQEELSRLGFNARFKLIEAFRKAALENLERWSHEAAAETKMGRAEDKIKKNRLVTLKTPGPEILQKPETFGGSDGLTATRLDPFGVIASIIPCTNSTETVINNGISMIAAGNSVVFNPHPIAKNVSADCVQTINRAIAAAGGPKDILCCIANPSIESASALMRSPLVSLILVTGGGAVVDAAMRSDKRAICAGPGNPPAVVDETAELARAAKSIVAGASLDNNVVCTDEKEIIAVEQIADQLKTLILKEPVIELRGADIERLTKLVLVERSDAAVRSAGVSPAVVAASSPPHPARDCALGGRRDAGDTAGRMPAVRTEMPALQTTAVHFSPCKNFVGKSPSHILRELGIECGDEIRLILVDVDKDHPLVWTEQLMPVLPLCRVKDADAAIAHAVAVEAGRRHTASIHSLRLDRITAFSTAMNCSICVVNEANYAGLGLDGEGYTSFSIATPTGEGLTTARTFCRERRLAVCGGLKR